MKNKKMQETKENKLDHTVNMLDCVGIQYSCP